MRRFENAQGRGKRFFGLHFVPGVAEYKDDNGVPYRVYLNSETTKKMDATFEGRPFFILHVDEVEDDIELLKREADGFVVKSFYNAADGKHWAEFLVLSDEAESLIRDGGYRLSNSYYVTHKGPPGTWNGVKYRFEVAAAEYEHLALVPDPRYSESVIMTPDEFQAYNEQRIAEVPKFYNSKKGSKRMKGLSFFTRQKVKNSEDYAKTSVTLPKSGKEYTILQLVNKADEVEMGEGDDTPRLVNSKDLIEVDGKKMTIGKFMKLHNQLLERLENEDDEEMENEDEEDEDDVEEEDFDNEDEDQDDEVVEKTEKAEKKSKGLDNKKKNKKSNKKKNSYDDEDVEEEVERRVKAREKATRLRNARGLEDDDDSFESGMSERNRPAETSIDQIRRGSLRYGTAKA